MRENVKIVVVIFVSLIFFLQFIFPTFLTHILKNKIGKTFNTSEILLSLESMPNAKISLGYVDNISCSAKNVLINDLRWKSLNLNGSMLHVDISELLFPTDNLNYSEHFKKLFKSVANIEVEGVITQEDFQEFIIKKFDNFRDVEITINPNEIIVSGRLKLFGGEMNIKMLGQLYVKNGDLYFQTSKLNVENDILRQFSLASLLKNINLNENFKLPLDMQFNKIEQREGQFFIKAVKS